VATQPNERHDPLHQAQDASLPCTFREISRNDVQIWSVGTVVLTGNHMWLSKGSRKYL